MLITSFKKKWGYLAVSAATFSCYPSFLRADLWLSALRAFEEHLHLPENCGWEGALP